MSKINLNLNTQPQLPDAPLPISIIGAGGIVCDAHLPAYRKAGWEVTGIFDIKSEKARQVAREFDIAHACESMEELIEATPSGGVYDVAVPAPQIQAVLDQLPAGSRVLLQKPLGEDLRQARQITELCKEKAITGGVNFQLRYAPFVVAAREMLGRGLLGELHDVEVRLNVHTPWENWPFLRGRPRVEILYHSIHYLDLIRSLLGDPDGVYAKTVRHPQKPELSSTKSSIILDYGDQIRASVSTNHDHCYGTEHQESFVKLEGTSGAVKITMGVNMNYPEGAGDRFAYCLLTETDTPVWNQVNIPGSWFPEAFIGSMGSFQCWVEGTTTEFTSSLVDACRTMEVVEAAYRSSEQGAVVLSLDNKEINSKNNHESK